MKAVFIAYNQAHHEDVLAVMESLGIKGYTYWEELAGEGSKDGDPHLGTHAWPTRNGALLTIVDDDKVAKFMEYLHKLDLAFPQQGLRTFVWNVEATV
ncbi:MAG: hypothetical protein LKK19_06450 [Bacteroidales bacterium]|jgi:hypothetical protein|nr:hypothetical protein [Bacteroidales bacterium]MCI2122326.1 hypothetical protein [Bacteroidales bacterium]MCI2145348.1 hypothetical protein [Bacteroidales bacterium]